MTHLKGYGWGLGSVLLVSAAQLLMKWGMAQLPAIAAPLPFLAALRPHWPAALAVAVGLFAYGLSMLCWFHALKRLPLSRAYPLLSLSYALVWLLALLLPGFPDTFSAVRLLAIGLIVVGVGLVCATPRGG